MKRKRFASTVTLTLVLLPLVGLLRPPSPITGVPADKLWIEKAKWSSGCDVVMAGCSRVAMGLSPSAVGESLPGCRIVNFGFTSQTYSQDYLQAVKGLLDPKSNKKVVVFSIQPVNFLESFCDRSGYRLSSHVNPAIRWIELNHPMIASFTKPFVYNDIIRTLTGSTSGYYQEYHPDGWISSRWVPENPSYWLPRYREYYLHDKVSGKLIKDFLDTVRELRKDNVAVFALRLPTTAEMISLEDKMSGMDLKRFRRQFQACGGAWVEIPDLEFDCYDGSHLSEKSAIEVSQILGKSIKKKLSINQINQEKQ